MLLLGESTLWEQMKRFVCILLRKDLPGLVILKIMLMDPPKKLRVLFLNSISIMELRFIYKWSYIFRIICKVRFLGLSLGVLNSGSEVQSSALLTSPLYWAESNLNIL